MTTNTIPRPDTCTQPIETPRQAITHMLQSIKMGNEPRHWDTDKTVAWFESILAAHPEVA